MNKIPGQFRLSSIQVYNWGTFSGVHTVPVAREGYLVTGASGSGKSTLIDAVSAVLVPPSTMRFNAAAQDPGTKSGRNLITYCRGAWRREHSEDIDELTQSYLRTGATWSGVALTYDDGEGAAVTALRLMFLNAHCHQPTDIVNLFVLVPRVAELWEFNDLAKEGLDLRKAKQQHKDALAVQRSHSPFMNVFRRELGIADQAALTLLHRTQSAKSLGDLNALMRDFMLPEPPTLKTAADAVEKFTELNAAYQGLHTTRMQIEALEPIRSADEDIARLTAETTLREEEQTHLDAYVTHHRLALERTKWERITGDIAVQQATLEDISTQAADLKTTYDQLQVQIHGHENIGLLQAQHDLTQAKQQLESIQSARELFEKSTRVVGAVVPNTSEDFTNLRLQLQELTTELVLKASKYSERRQALYGALNTTQETVTRLQQELDFVRTYRSPMDQRLLEARRRVAEFVGIEENELPFVADLLTMRDSETNWQPAAERVLGGFARTLIVPEEYYARVSDAIDAMNLGARLVYIRFTSDLARRIPSSFAAGSLGSKIDVTPGRFFTWLQSELSSRFDYECVDTVAELRKTRRAVTRNGQFRDDFRHEKDDRTQIDDRSSWVLSTSYDDKIDSLREQIRMAKAELAKRFADSEGFEDSVKEEATRHHACNTLLAVENFAAIDTTAAAQAVSQRQTVVDELTDSNPELKDLQDQRDRVVFEQEKLKQQEDEARDVLGGLRRELRQAEELIAQLEERQKINRSVPEEVVQRLNELVGTFTRKIRADNVVDVQKKMLDALNSAQQALARQLHEQERKTAQVMLEFLQQWPERRGDLFPEKEYRGDFIALLHRLENDDLPAFEARFLELLRSQTQNNLNRLLLQIQRATQAIRDGIEPINASLMAAEFEPDTHLQIEVRESQPAEAREFMAKLKEVVDGVLNDESTLASEERFLKLRAVIEMLKITDETPERIYRLRLDTRKHVTFLGVEHNADGTRGAVYDSAQGLSGGQAQKLVFFCLAAALRYQLTGAGLSTSRAKNCTIEHDGKQFSRFGTVILDEAFDRADSQFTRRGMDVFNEFGFHMVLATPEKMLQTIQDYIGGAAVVQCFDRKHSTLALLEIEDA